MEEETNQNAHETPLDVNSHPTDHDAEQEATDSSAENKVILQEEVYKTCSSSKLGHWRSRLTPHPLTRERLREGYIVQIIDFAQARPGILKRSIEEAHAVGREHSQGVVFELKNKDGGIMASSVLVLQTRLFLIEAVGPEHFTAAPLFTYNGYGLEKMDDVEKDYHVSVFDHRRGDNQPTPQNNRAPLVTDRALEGSEYLHEKTVLWIHPMEIFDYGITQGVIVASLNNESKQNARRLRETTRMVLLQSQVVSEESLEDLWNRLEVLQRAPSSNLSATPPPASARTPNIDTCTTSAIKATGRLAVQVDTSSTSRGRQQEPKSGRQDRNARASSIPPNTPTAPAAMRTFQHVHVSATSGILHNSTKRRRTADSRGDETAENEPFAKRQATSDIHVGTNSAIISRPFEGDSVLATIDQQSNSQSELGPMIVASRNEGLLSSFEPASQMRAEHPAVSSTSPTGRDRGVQSSTWPQPSRSSANSPSLLDRLADSVDKELNR